MTYEQLDDRLNKFNQTIYRDVIGPTSITVREDIGHAYIHVAQFTSKRQLTAYIRKLEA